ncbi:MAG: ferredoxin family protein [bacterium]|nr:ferredoxin family protein [bacterium]
MNVDLSQFDHITDRVERARAKAEAMRNANAGGESTGDTGEGAAAPAAAGQTQEALVEEKAGLELLEFNIGQNFKFNDRSARVVGIRYDMVSYIYEDDPNHINTADRFRLSHAFSEDRLEFTGPSAEYLSESVNESQRVDYHQYLWLDTRKGMTDKKRRPKIIAIINPDYCTGCDACIEVCPTDCIEDVPVQAAGLDGIGTFCEVRLEDCIGCKQCVPICPWEAIQMCDTDKVEEAYGLPAGTL